MASCLTFTLMNAEISHQLIETSTKLCCDTCSYARIHITQSHNIEISISQLKIVSSHAAVKMPIFVVESFSLSRISETWNSKPSINPLATSKRVPSRRNARDTQQRRNYHCRETYEGNENWSIMKIDVETPHSSPRERIRIFFLFSPLVLIIKGK